MSALDYRAAVETVLHRVEKPARYIGGEWNQTVKDHAGTRVRVALCFPDVYEIGMSHLGFRLLYGILNARPDMLAERAFTPWPDMQAELTTGRLPLTTLETATPLARFDVVGFSLQYELCFTNVLAALDLGGIPLRTRDRTDGDPLILAGGPVVFNPEPVADFIDAFVIGDGEEAFPELAELFVDLREAGLSRPDILRRLARVPGVYVPSLVRVERDPATGFLIPVGPAEAGVPFPIERRILMDLDAYPFPTDIVVPFTEIVHDRVSVEIMRGCQVGCRFCQAGYIYRPVRERSHAAVMDTARRSLAATGYDEVGLTSLNSGEYPGINRLISEMMDELVEERTAVSFSSLRASSLTEHLAQQIRRVRKTGFTIAPEAGTDRLRKVINKNITEADVLQACEMAFANGWSHIKLYFMIGQPTETQDDLEGMVDIGRKCLAIGRRHQGNRARLSLSASSFIPKPFTPFQWCRMEEIAELRRKQDWVKARCEKAGIKFKWHHPEVSGLEGVFSLGDRGLGDVIEAAWRRGCSFDGWTEQLDMDKWRAAFAECGVDPDTYLKRDFGPDDALPWDFLDIGVTKKFLARDLEKALAGVEDETCGGDNCYGCAPFATACTGFLHGRRTSSVYFGGVEAAGPVPAAAPSGPGARLPVYRQHAPAAAAETGAAPTPAASPAVGPDAAEPPAAGPAPEMVFGWRARFSKVGPLRFLSQLDLARTLIRAFRRAGVPVAYSRGFHPMPRLAFGPALPVGLASEAEFLDLETLRPMRPEEFLAAVNATLPAGLRFAAIVPLDRGTGSLSGSISRADYRAEVPEDAVRRALESAGIGVNGGGLDGAHDRLLAAFLQRSTVPWPRAREGRVQEVDLRPYINGLRRETRGLRLELGLDNGRTARPLEVLGALYGSPEAAETFPVLRLEQYVVKNGRALSPLLAAAGGASGTRDPR